MEVHALRQGQVRPKAAAQMCRRLQKTQDRVERGSAASGIRGMVHKLTEFEKSIAMFLAGRHNEKEAKYGAMTYDNGSGVNAHYIGICGEIAVAQLLGGKMDFSTYDRGDTGIDLSILGVNVDVKTTTYMKDPWLRVELEHWKSDTCYVLCAFDGEVVKLVGRCSGRFIKKHGEKKRLTKNGPENYILSGTKLPKFKIKDHSAK